MSLGLFAVCLAGVALLLVLQTRSTQTDQATGDNAIRVFTVRSADHADGRVAYAQDPPVGGEHAPMWQNCGFYSEPVVTEQAVHSLEHGAVWITYRPGLPSDQIEVLRRLAAGRSHVLVSPWPLDLASPVVASAWGRQRLLPSAHDGGLADFVRRFRTGPQAPEPGAPCTGGAGVGS